MAVIHKLFSIKRTAITLLISLAVLSGSAGVSWSADYQKGFHAATRGDFATALREWIPLAEAGQARVQYNLGWMYSLGRGVLMSNKTAVRWYMLAAEQGHTFSQYELGMMYGEGKGVRRDYLY